MAYVTVHTLDGDTHALLERKRQYFDPVVRRVAPEFGAIASITAETERGLMVVNVWESADRVPAFTGHPDILAARDAADLPAPSTFDRYASAGVELFRKPAEV